MDYSTSNLTFGPMRILTNPKGIRILLWLVLAAAFPLYALSELAPLLDKQGVISESLADKNYQNLRDDTLKAIESPGQVKSTVYNYRVSSLIVVSIPIKATGEESGPKLDPVDPRIRILYDKVVLMSGIFIILILAARALLPVLTQLKVGSLQIEIPRSAYEDKQKEPSVEPSVPSETPVVSFFLRDVANALQRSENLFARATLMLIGGIVMAFIGVAVFYITLPETSANESAIQFWPKAIRPMGVLIFVESIAWFLLRQYRALIEDYKWFHRLYLKRANYLAALRILGTTEIRPEEMYVAAALINEDLTGKLKVGETTEALEVQKLPDDNPIPEILRAISSIKMKKKEEQTPKEEKKGS